MNTNDSIESSLDHLGRLASRIASLQAARQEAEQQVCHRIGREYAAQTVSASEVMDFYSEFRVSAGSGFTSRWNDSVSIRSSAIDAATRNAQWRPNGEDGAWFGYGRPAQNEPAPISGTSVVYLLHNDEGLPCYLGSTMRFRSRLKRHQMDGKEFDLWRAWPCRDREHAYEREAEMLREVTPYLNKRAGR